MLSSDTPLNQVASLTKGNGMVAPGASQRQDTIQPVSTVCNATNHNSTQTEPSTVANQNEYCSKSQLRQSRVL